MAKLAHRDPAVVEQQQAQDATVTSRSLSQRHFLSKCQCDRWISHICAMLFWRAFFNEIQCIAFVVRRTMVATHASCCQDSNFFFCFAAVSPEQRSFPANASQISTSNHFCEAKIYRLHNSRKQKHKRRDETSSCTSAIWRNWDAICCVCVHQEIEQNNKKCAAIQLSKNEIVLVKMFWHFKLQCLRDAYYYDLFLFLTCPAFKHLSNKYVALLYLQKHKFSTKQQ